MIGKKLSHFEIREKIGQGGMGVVYKAVDLNLNRPVVLKLLSPETVQSEPRKKRFIQEAKSASSLNHPNIVTIYEIGSDDGIDFIAMEYVAGVPLSQRLAGAGLDVGQTIRIAIQIADALSKAHQNGIIHRDIKPQNIMITDADDVKVLDFGLAKLVEPLESNDPAEDSLHSTLSAYTEPGVVLGTLHYMSPEQVEGKRLDARTDIFSFGCVLYELLSGQRPFSGKTKTAVLTSILRDTPEPLQSLRSGTPVELVRIVSKMLEKDPQYRYQHMQDVLTDLRKLKRDMESGETTRVSPHARRNKLPWVAAFIVAVCLIGAGVYLWTQKQSAQPPARQMELHLISDFPGSHKMASFSPDGSMIAFVNDTEGIPQIWVKNLVRGEPIPVTFDKSPASRPRWSPKNDQIVFCRGSFEVSREAESIWSVPPLGGKPRKIIDTGRNPNFSPDGSQLVFERREELWIADANGLNQRKLEGIPVVAILLADRNPAYSPDGSQIAFFQSERGPAGDYWVIPSAGGKARRLTFDVSDGGAPAWMPDGKHILFPSGRTGSLILWKISVNGGTPEAITTGTGNDTDPEISADGNKVIFTNTRSLFSIEMFDPATGASKRLFESRNKLVAPKFSPDGTRITYFSSPGGLFTIQTDGSGNTLITTREEDNIHPRWSPDGSSLYFYQVRPKGSFRKISVEGGVSTVVEDGWKWETQYGAEISPDGARLVYSSRKDGVITAARVRDLSTGREHSLAVPLDDPHWSRDGQRILGYDLQNWVWVCPVDGSECRKIVQGINPVWAPDPSRLYFQRKGGVEDGAELWTVSLDGSNERKITELRPMMSIGYYYDVSDKDQIIWMRFQEGKQELWMMTFPEFAPKSKNEKSPS